MTHIGTPDSWTSSYWTTTSTGYMLPDADGDWTNEWTSQSLSDFISPSYTIKGATGDNNEFLEWTVGNTVFPDDVDRIRYIAVRVLCTSNSAGFAAYWMNGTTSTELIGTMPAFNQSPLPAWKTVLSSNLNITGKDLSDGLNIRLYLIEAGGVLDTMYVTQVEVTVSYVPINTMYSNISSNDTYSDDGEFTLTSSRLTNSTERSYYPKWHLLGGYDGGTVSSIADNILAANYTYGFSNKVSGPWNYYVNVENISEYQPSYSDTSATVFTNYVTRQVQNVSIGLVGNNVMVSWDLTSQPSTSTTSVKYKIYWKTWTEGNDEPSTFNQTPFTTANSAVITQQIDGSVDNNTNYRAFVRSVSGGTESDDSSIVSYYYLADNTAATAFDVTDDKFISTNYSVSDDNSLNLNWTNGTSGNNTHVELYIYYSATNSNPTDLLAGYSLSLADNATTATVSNCVNGYYKCFVIFKNSQVVELESR